MLMQTGFRMIFMQYKEEFSFLKTNVGNLALTS